MYKDSELFQLYSVATQGTPDLVLVLFFFFFLKVYRQYLVIFELEPLEWVLKKQQYPNRNTVLECLCHLDKKYPQPACIIQAPAILGSLSSNEMGLQCEFPETGAVLSGFAWTVHSVSPSSFVIFLGFANF